MAPPPQTLLPPTDWHDNPAIVGDWRWSREGSLSVARFGSPQTTLFSLTCDPVAGRVTLLRAGQAGAAPALTVRTTSLSRTLAIPPAGGSPALAAHDPLVDAMAFSRGRFAVAAPGLATLYLPSWPEVGRVIEDCR